MEFKDPWILMLIPIFFIGFALLNRLNRAPHFKFSSQKLVEGVYSTLKVRLLFIPMLLRGLVIIIFIIALAGPRMAVSQADMKMEGIDIVLSIDTSGSMAAEDFKKNGKRVNRLEVVKDVVRDFIKQRKNDRMGLVVFSGLAYTACPLTTDYEWLTKNLEKIELGMIEDGTAIGSAIVSSVARLKDSKAKSKVVILLTDGVNTAGTIDPLTAAKTAQSFGIKVYTIGAGSKGLVPYPMVDFFGRKVYQNVQIDIDDNVLQKIAENTNAKYFRATDMESLKNIYNEIDKLEKTEIEHKGFREYHELFGRFVLVGLLLLLTEIFLKQVVFFRIP